MRIVHTSDWHAGKVWKGKKRLEELTAILEHLAGFVEREKIDLLIHSGDVFDSGVPPAEAERAVFRFFRRVGAAGVPSLVIAGNHDSPARLEAWGLLSELAGCRTVPRPAPPERGGLIEIETRGGERALVAAVPFASSRQLVSALQVVEDEGGAYSTYADRMRRIFEAVSKPFRSDTVNLITAHVYIDGAVLARSERQVHVGQEWAVSAAALPAVAHYAALGHIHKPQRVDAAGMVPTYYAGSALQLDFGEVGEEKSFVVVEAEAGKPAQVERVPYEGGKPLLDLRATLEELETDVDTLRDAGWLRVTVPLTVPDPDVSGKVRRLLPNTVTVRVDLPEVEADGDEDRPPPGAPAAEIFAAYFRRHHGRPPEPALIETFEKLYRQAAEF